MVFIFKIAPFNMTFEEIKNMTFVQAVILLKELNDQTRSRQKQLKKSLSARKDVMPVFDIATGIF